MKLQSNARKRILEVQKTSGRETPMLAIVYDIKTGRKRPIPLSEYMEMLDTLEKYLHLDEKQRNREYPESLRLIKEIRFCVQFNSKFREESADQLRDILDEMYVVLQANQAGHG